MGNLSPPHPVSSYIIGILFNFNFAIIYIYQAYIIVDEIGNVRFCHLILFNYNMLRLVNQLMLAYK